LLDYVLAICFADGLDECIHFGSEVIPFHSQAAIAGDGRDLAAKPHLSLEVLADFFAMVENNSMIVHQMRPLAG
jgi:hypothetical protein